jgi:predicted ATPase/DNA-binding winged helix-turn-helix (wHTH) protein
MSPGRGGDRPAVRIEPENEWAWCGERRLPLMPRAFAVLRHLVEHPQRLVTKDDLLAAVWGDTIVSDAALASCIRDLRRALGDSSRAPRYIQTVHRRGFRFIGPIARPRPEPSTTTALPSPAAAPETTSTLVGREAELGRLHDRFDRALHGQRQLVFVTGEPGIGKTALVEAFLAGLDTADAPRVARGQCVEQYGAGEAYLPVLEALGRSGREPRGERLVGVLRQQAPTWLMQLPALLTDQDLEAVQRRAAGATRDRMLRELVEAFDALTLDAPLVLVLEDLHWSDSATVDLLAMLARRREAARLLVLGTYRPADVAAHAHPLRAVKPELQLHDKCEELPLQFLSVEAVGQYLSHRFPGHRFPAELAHVLHRSTDGNPLFLVNTIDDLAVQGRLREVGGRWELSVSLADVALAAPTTLSRMVERQLERLTPAEQAMLAVASVAGAEFSAAVAAADGIDAEDGDRRCAALARRGQFLRATGVAEWPDGTVAGRYAFIHALYQQVLYGRVPVGHRVALHRRTGERLERGYGRRAGEIAGELAMHFEHGWDFERAVLYRTQAGEHALRQHAYREAAAHATRALELLGSSPAAPERPERELTLQIVLATALTAITGYATPEVARAYSRARELCDHVEDTARVLPVLLGLGRFHHSRGDSQIARGLARRLSTMAEATGDATVRLAAHNAQGIVAFYAGEFDAALAHMERGLTLYDPVQHGPTRSAVFRGGQDPGLACLVYAAWALQLLGYPSRAAARMRAVLEAARSLEHPFSLAYAYFFATGFHQARGEREAAQELQDAALAHATVHGFGLFLVAGAIHRGWLLAQQGRAEDGLAQMREGLTAWRAGAELRVPAFLASMAEVHATLGRPEAGLSLVTEAMAVAERTGQHYWDAELYRLKGALTLQGHAGSASAEAWLLDAIGVARQQKARWFELRAATDLSRLWASRGQAKDAHVLLSDVYTSFTEGFETADLSQARSVLAQVERAGPGS